MGNQRGVTIVEILIVTALVVGIGREPDIANNVHLERNADPF